MVRYPMLNALLRLLGKKFTIDLVYKDLEKKPTHIIVVFSSSKYGDYFTGSTSSLLYLDDLELIYGDSPQVK